jgi:hypothetical protein
VRIELSISPEFIADNDHFTLGWSAFNQKNGVQASARGLQPGGTAHPTGLIRKMAAQALAGTGLACEVRVFWYTKHHQICIQFGTQTAVPPFFLEFPDD